MKKIGIVVLVCLLLLGCGQNAVPEETTVPAGLVIPVDNEGYYTGFDDLPEAYTLEQALADGCHAVVYPQMDTDSRSVEYGQERLWNFLYNCCQGTPGYLRTVYFLGEEVCYRDLWYTGEAYYYFENELGPKQPEPFTLLRRLTGIDGMPSRQCSLYVFTNSAALTYEKIMGDLLSSSLPTEPYIPYIWVTSQVQSTNTYTPEQFAGCATWQEVQAVAEDGEMIVTKEGIVQKFPGQDGTYIQIRYTAPDLTVESIEVVEDSGYDQNRTIDWNWNRILPS